MRTQHLVSARHISHVNNMVGVKPSLGSTSRYLVVPISVIGLGFSGDYVSEETLGCHAMKSKTHLELTGTGTGTGIGTATGQ